MMSTLPDYIEAFARRGACTCGRCIDAPDAPEKHQPNGHTADVYFFKVVAADGAKADDLQAAIQSHKGVFQDCDPLDGKEHSYIELGAWIGDQGAALTLMGLGTVLSLWELITPKCLHGLDKPLMDLMAGQGLVTIRKTLEQKQGVA